MRRSPEAVVEEIRYWHRTHSVVDFAFYDDALLVNAENHIIPILEGIMAAGLHSSISHTQCPACSGSHSGDCRFDACLRI